MPKLLGRNVYIRVGPDVLGSFRTKSMTIGNTPIDVTTPDVDSDDDNTLLFGESLAGEKVISFAGDGVFSDTNAEEALRAAAQSDTAEFTMSFDIPRFGRYSGKWHVDSLEFTGEYNGAVLFSMQVTSRGQIAFTRHADIQPSVVALQLNQGNNLEYSLAMTLQPTSDVIVDISRHPTVAGIGVNPASRTFTNANYATPKIITLTAAGNVPIGSKAMINHVIRGNPADARYQGMIIDNVEVLIV